MSRSRDSATSRETWVASLIIGVATALVYSNTFDASFHFDDLGSIVENESLRDLSSQWPPSGARWLGYLTFALNYRLGGLEVFGYHLVNLLIHLCNGLLVFWLTAITLRTPAMRRAEAGPLLRRYLPLTAGLLFAVHPIATQAVTYIVQRFTSLATLFFLLSLALCAQARLALEADRPSRARAACLYCLSVVAAAGAMKSKEISFTLPFVAAGYELLFFRRPRRLLLLAPLAATALLVPLGLRTALTRTLAETSGISRSVYLLTQSRVVLTYLRLLLLPVQQNLDYDFRLSHSLTDPAVLFALAVLLAVATLAVFLLRRARRTNRAPGVLVFFGVAWFFVTLSVESSLIPIRDVINEHRVYLPSAGVAVALATALLWAAERLRWHAAVGLQCAVALLITAGPLSLSTYARNFVWKDEVILWSDVVAKSPGKARPRNNLGHAYHSNGRLEEAGRECREAIRLAPGLADAHYNLGAVDWAKGLHDEAAQEWRQAIRLDPGLAEAHDALGVVAQAKGEMDDAAREYREAVRLAPGRASAHMYLGEAYEAKEQLDDAVRELREAIRLDPGLVEAHDELGVVYQIMGRLAEAVREHREAIRLAPDRAAAHNNLGNAMGQGDDAIREYLEAIRLDPALADPHYNLGKAYREKGQLDDAIREYREAIRLAPGLAMAHFNLGNTYRAKGQLHEAESEYRQAIRLEPGRAEAHNNLAAALMQQGRRVEAAEEIRRALTLKPKPELVFNLAHLLEAAGLRAEAITQYQRFLEGEVDPERAEIARRRIADLRVSRRERESRAPSP